MTTAMPSTHFQPVPTPVQLAAIRPPIRVSAGQFAAVDGKKADFRSDPEPSGLTRGELRQIVLDILG